jgi:hypothetical protein
VKVLGNGVTPFGITLSNNNSPGIEITNGSNALNFGVASGPGGYSVDANTNDAVIRSTNGRLFLQSGVGSSAVCINTFNFVGIGTNLPIRPLDVRGDAYVRGAISKSGVLSVQDSNMSREIRLTAHSNQNAYIEFYPDLYFKRIGTGTIDSPPLLYVGSNGNIGIGTSNNKARLSMTGYDSAYNYGPHIEAFTYADSNRPVFQQLNWSHNNCALTFDGYYDGTNWKASDNTNSYQIYKIDGNLCINNAYTAFTGDTISYSNALTINSAGNIGIGTSNQGTTKLLVNGKFSATNNVTFKAGDDALDGVNTHFPFTNGKNYIRGTTILADTNPDYEKVGIGTSTPGHTLDVNGTTKTSKLIIGNDPLSAQIGTIQLSEIEIGPSPLRKLQFTLTGSFPNDYMLFLTPLSASGTFDDNFSVTVMSKTSSQIVLSIYRTDANSGWGQNLIVQAMIIGG